MKYLFGPVNSRRLGLSQGIDLLPAGTCNFSCIYCELGKTELVSCERCGADTDDIIEEIDSLLADVAKSSAIDIYTITASGEPTLHPGIGRILRHIKERTSKPVSVLTNGSLLHYSEVRNDLLAADIVIPSLDAVLPDSFRKVNRPTAELEITTVIEGITQFSHEFCGELWLEILLVKGINDRPKDILALKRALQNIKASKVQLNTVDRPPLESFAKPLSGDKLRAIATQLDGPVEIIASCGTRKTTAFKQADEQEIIELLTRRPCTEADISQALNYESAQTNIFIQALAESNIITKKIHDAKGYWSIKESER